MIFKNTNGIIKYINSELHDLKHTKNQTKYLFRRSSGRPERGIFLSCEISRAEIHKVRASVKSKNKDKYLQKFIKNKVLWFPDGQLVKNKALFKTLSKNKKDELSGMLNEFRNNNKKIAADAIKNVIKINPDDGAALLAVVIRTDSDSKETKHIGEIDEYSNFFKKGILLKKHKTLYDATCLTCNNKKQVQTFAERPLPYYYTDNYLYFPDGQLLSTRKGFPLCDDCYLQLQKGIRFIKDNLDYSISQLGSDRSELNFWLIPHLHDPGILLVFNDELENNKDLYLKGLRKLCSTLQTISDIDESDTKNIDSFLRFSSLFYTLERYYMRVTQYTPGIYPTQLQRLIRTKEEIDKRYLMRNYPSYSGI
jgi:CRISPR-associated protein TM1802 (cas_TM1802)